MTFYLDQGQICFLAIDTGNLHDASFSMELKFRSIRSQKVRNELKVASVTWVTIYVLEFGPTVQ